MNIGFDAKRLFNNNSGLGNYSKTLVKNLCKFFPNNQYQLYAPKLVNNIENDFFLNQKQFKVHLSKNSFSNAYWRTFQLANELQTDRIDIFHGLSHELPIGISKTNVKSIVTIHDLIFKKFPKTYPFFDRLIYDNKCKYSCENADKIVAISQFTKIDIVNFYNIDPNKIEVVYQACNPLFLQKSTLNKVEVLQKYNLPAEYILYVGAITERKNILNLIKAYAQLPFNCQIPLVIIGQGKNYLNKCKALVNDKNLTNKVLFISNLKDNSALQVVYQNAHCFVYPSLYEGFGIPIIEAMFSNTPVVASYTSSLPEAGGKSAIYFDPNNVEEIAFSIQKTLELTLQQRKENIENGYRYAKLMFSAETTSSQLVNVYKGLI